MAGNTAAASGKREGREMSELKPCPTCKQECSVTYPRCATCLGEKVVPDEAGFGMTCPRCLGSGHATHYSAAPGLQTVPESGQKSMRAEFEMLRDALRAFENAACMVNQWRSTLAVWVDGTVDHEQWRSLNDTFDKLQAARATARQALGDPT